MTLRWNPEALGLEARKFARVEDFYRRSWWRTKPSGVEVELPLRGRNFRMLVPLAR